MVDEQLQNAARIAHDVGIATWFGGQVFGKFTLNPTVAVIDSHAERGKVVNTGWFTFNPLGATGLAVAAAVRVAARTTEINPAQQTPAERVLSQLEDGLMVTSVALTALTGIQGMRLARQAPEGAVPIEDGTTPAPETPEPAAGSCA